MQKQNIIRAFLFAFFFSIGAAVFSYSILCDELLAYYRNKELLSEAEESLKKLKSLNVDYDVLLNELEKDPNLIRRIGPATLGTEPEDTGVIYPQARAEELAAARKILTEDSKSNRAKSRVAVWLERCNEPYRRVILFLAGALLIIISLVCFGPAQSTAAKQQ